MYSTVFYVQLRLLRFNVELRCYGGDQGIRLPGRSPGITHAYLVEVVSFSAIEIYALQGVINSI